MSKKDFAKKIKLSQSYVSMLIAGQRAFTKELEAKFKKNGFDPATDYAK